MTLRSHATLAFPVPVFLSLQPGGIDISARSVKFILLREEGDTTELHSYGETALSPGIVVGGDIEEPEKLIEILRSIRLRHGIRSASASLPEGKSYLYQVVVPKGVASIREGIEFDFESHVPLPPTEAMVDFEIVREVSGGTLVSVTAYARRIVDSYREVFQRSGITLRALEVESQALARALVGPTDLERALMVVDFGKHTTRISVVEKGVAVFSATLDVGGDTLTTAIMKQTGATLADAEAMKNEHGILQARENAKLVEAMITTVSAVKDEVGKHLSYWNSPTPTDAPRMHVEKIILCGGNANLRGFPEYLGEALQIPVSVANVWINAFSTDSYIPSLHFHESLEYATALGLALRGASRASW